MRGCFDTLGTARKRVFGSQDFLPWRDREQVGVSGGKTLFTARPLSRRKFPGYQRDSRSENQKLGALPPGG